MAAIIGAVVGYLFGTRDGQEGWNEIVDAWKVITTSEEVRDMVSGGVSMLRDVLGRGGETFAERMGRSNADGALHQAA
ncbi:MAG TPA: hypothetical protein VG014_08565 [Acidimicrobiales bacterium]|jgi:hypothetical protein|nr:hypothetical protein [Acidimicrobiales bacterium]